MLAYALTAILSAADGGHEVLALLERQAAAWSKGDLDGFCSIYADDAVFVSPSGVTKGRAEVLARYKKKYPTVRDGRVAGSNFDHAFDPLAEIPRSRPRGEWSAGQG